MTGPSRRLAQALAAAALGLAALALAPTPALAQTCPIGQHCFYAPPLMPHPSGGTSGWDLVLASPNGTITGTYAFGAGVPTPFSVTSGAPLKVALSSSLGVASSYGAVEARGLFVAASRPDLSVVQRFVVGPWNSSASIKDATSSLGTRFRAGGYVLDRVNTANSGHDVVSIYAPFGATVTVDPPGAATDFWGDGYVGDARTVTLGVGQTVLWRTRVIGSCGGDITGALVTADAPVSVITGGRGWAGACGPHSVGGCGDDGVDHLIPEAGLGTSYVVDKYPGADAERVTVVATVDDTDVWVDGALVATLAAGGVHRFVNAGLALIEASDPVYVYQDAGLATCEAGLSIIPPIAFAAGTALGIDFNVNGSGQASVLIAAADAGSVLLDGAPPPSAVVTAVPTRPELTRVRFAVTGGDHRVAAASDFQLGLVTAASGTGLFAYYNPFRVPGCGDGNLDPGEACDDGNVVSGDGCSPQCRLEIGVSGCQDDADCVAAARCLDGVCVARCFDDADCDDGDACTIDSCDDVTGGCSALPAAAGTPCDGGDAVCAPYACDGAYGCSPVCVAPIWYGVVSGPDGALRAVRCSLPEGGPPVCDMTDGALTLYEPMCEP